MTHSINILLLPANSPIVDLGNTPCKWNTNSDDQRNNGNLELLDAPYAFYDYISSVLGYDAADDNSIDKQFCAMFFNLIDKEIALKGFEDEMQFTIRMPKFFGLCFQILITKEA